MKLTSNLLKRLPKVELLCHLDGCLRPETMVALARRDNIPLPTFNADELSNIMKIGKKRGSLEDYIKRFDLPLQYYRIPLHWREFLLSMSRIFQKRMFDMPRYVFPQHYIYRRKLPWRMLLMRCGKV